MSNPSSDVVRDAQSAQAYDASAKQKAAAKLSRIPVKVEQHEILPFPAQNWLTGQFRAAAAQQGRADLVSLWAGQAAALCVSDDAADVFAELAAGLPA